VVRHTINDVHPRATLHNAHIDLKVRYHFRDAAVRDVITR